MKNKLHKLLIRGIIWAESKRDYYAGIPTLSGDKIIFKHGWAIRRGAQVIKHTDRAEDSIVSPTTD